MKSFNFSLLLIVVLFLLASHSVNAQDVPLTVIANSKGAPAELSQAQLKSILKGEKLRWKDGSKVIIALMKTNTTVGMNTCRKLYNMTSNELNKLFLALVFQGKGEAPSFFNTMSELQTFVSQTPGTIGIIEPNAANNERVIFIDGKKSI